MEFHEKLQLLRKRKGWTQEQLADRLFVSRAAVSKWESGRGYPNLKSLQDLSGLFSVSVDELLSEEELAERAEPTYQSRWPHRYSLVLGTLDLLTLSLLFLPLFGQQEGAQFRAVSLLAHTGLSRGVRMLAVGMLLLFGGMGLLQLGAVWSRREAWLPVLRVSSVGIHILAALMFVLSRQPYVTVCLFVLLLGKLGRLLSENQSKPRKKDL